MKALILHASAGGGHRRAAEALERAAADCGLDTVVRDVLDFTSPLYRRTYAKGYLALARSAPELWGYLYAKSDRSAQAPAERTLRAAFNQLNALSFLRFFRQTAPDLVLCTHFLPLELVGSLPAKARRGLPLFGVVTDFAAHSLWYCRNVDAYYVASEEARRQLVRKGQPADRIACTGIPILPGFLPGIDPRDARLRLGLPADPPLVLVLNGGLGVGPAPGLLDAFSRQPPLAQVVVVAGRNPRFEAKLRAAARNIPCPVLVQGFVENMHDWMLAADLVVTKPGGLTMAEVLAVGRPSLLMDPIPGQEQRNAEHLLEAGCALRAFDPDEAAWKIDALLRDPTRLRDLSERARLQGRPRAAADVLADALARIPGMSGSALKI
jgi:processive 1,2-diacylglycerol beta-glucosyltransferase